MKRVLNLMKKGAKLCFKVFAANKFIITPTGIIPIKE